MNQKNKPSSRHAGAWAALSVMVLFAMLLAACQPAPAPPDCDGRADHAAAGADRAAPAHPHARFQRPATGPALGAGGVRRPRQPHRGCRRH